MKRRTVLQLGIGGAVALGVAGFAVAPWDSPLRQGKLGPSARELFKAVGAAILDGCLPTDAAAHAAALDGTVNRIEGVIAGLPGPTQDELAELLSVLSTRLGRFALAGLWAPWADIPVAELQASLQSLRVSRLAVRRQVYQAFHEIVNSAYFADEKAWALMGYGGPVNL